MKRFSKTFNTWNQFIGFEFRFLASKLAYITHPVSRISFLLFSFFLLQIFTPSAYATAPYATAVGLAGTTTQDQTLTGSYTYNGDTLATSGAFTDTMGTLTLGASSTIDLGAASTADLTFANSSGTGWTAPQTLTITNWTGAAGATDMAGQIFVGVGGLTCCQLTDIIFRGYGSGAAGTTVTYSEPISLNLKVFMRLRVEVKCKLP